MKQTKPLCAAPNPTQSPRSSSICEGKVVDIVFPCFVPLLLLPLLCLSMGPRLMDQVYDHSVPYCLYSLHRCCCHVFRMFFLSCFPNTVQYTLSCVHSMGALAIVPFGICKLCEASSRVEKTQHPIVVFFSFGYPFPMSVREI